MKLFAGAVIALATMLQIGLPWPGGPAATGGTWTLLQHPSNTACASATTCAITLTQSIGSGNLLIFLAHANVFSYVTGTDNGGTYVACASCSEADHTGSLGQTSGGWIISSASESTTVTLNFSATTSGAQAEMWEYSYTATPSFDGANVIEYPTTTSAVEPAFTFSGPGPDISVHMARASASISAVSSGFSLDGSSSQRWAYLTTPAASWTAPTWTMSTAVTMLQQINFGFYTTACLNQKFVDFMGTSGRAVDATTLENDAHGWHGGDPTIHGTGGNLTFQAAASKKLRNSTGRLCDGGIYVDSSDTGLDYSTNSNATYLQWNNASGIMGTGDAASAGVWYYRTLPASDSSGSDDFTITGTGNADFVTAHEFTTPRLLEIECGGGVSTTTYALASNTWYWIEMVYNKTGNHTMKVYDSSTPPIQLASMTCAALGSAKPSAILLGNSNNNPMTSGYHFYYDGLKVSLDATDPLLP